MTQATMKIKALAQWFGSNRSLAQSAAAELGRLDWCGIPFAGGMSELPHIHTRAGVANDLHRHIINLARVIRDDALRADLMVLLDGMIFHPDELAAAQHRCLRRVQGMMGGSLFGELSEDVVDRPPNVEWAADYFAASWMARGGHSGKRTEFGQGLAVRFTSSGGDSAVRFRSAIESLPAWGEAIKRWNFTCMDGFTFIASAKDQPGHGLYVDAPWPDAGNEYSHRFSDSQQHRLAKALTRFDETRVVVRFGDHPLIRQLYPEDRWTWIHQESTNQKGNRIAEVLIVNGDSYAAAEGGRA